MPKTQHVMLDLETMGISDNAAIISIGAVDDEGRKFYRRVSLEDSMKAGLQADATAIEFWLKNASIYPFEDDKEEEPHKLYNALEDFSVWFPPKALLWSHTFDVKILRNAYLRYSLKTPWHYRQERDLRTLDWLVEKLLGGGNKNKDKPHHALEDAKFQLDRLKDHLDRLNVAVGIEV